MDKRLLDTYLIQQAHRMNLPLNLQKLAFENEEQKDGSREEKRKAYSNEDVEMSDAPSVDLDRESNQVSLNNINNLLK